MGSFVPQVKYAVLTVAIAMALVGARAFGADFTNDDVETVRRETQRIAGVPSRVVGTPGHGQIVKGLLDELREIPGIHVWEHRFPVVMPQVQGAELTIAEPDELAGRHRLYPLWPANVRLNSTPAAGITGRPVYIGQASIDEVPPNSLRGQIAVMELSGGEGWHRAAQAGASAIILLDDGQARQQDAASHFLMIPVNMPRFFVPQGPLAQALRSGRLTSIRLDSASQWAEVEATNIYVLVNAREGLPPRNALAIAAQIDSSGVVPEVAPGADAAVDAATLLVAIRHFAEHRPELPLVFSFVDAQSISQLGVRQMLGAMSVQSDDRRDSLKDEATVLEEYRELLQLSAQLESDGHPLDHLHANRYRSLHRIVRNEVDQDIVILEAELQSLRLEKLVAEGDRLAQIEDRIAVLLEKRTHLRGAQRSMLTSRPMTEGLRATSEGLWQRTRSRIIAQHEQAVAVGDRVDDVVQMRNEMMQALGLSADSKDTPIIFLLGIDISDAGVMVGPSRSCGFQRIDETGNARILREWIVQAIKDEERPVWPADSRPYVNLDPFTKIARHTTHVIGLVPTLTSPATSLGMPAVTWTTLEADRVRVDTPSDSYERLDWSRLIPQIKATLDLLKALAADADFARTAKPGHAKWSRVGGSVVDFAPGEPVARLPMTGYLVNLVPGRSGPDQCVPVRTAKPAAGVRRQEFVFTGADGRFRFDLLPARLPGWTKLFEVYLQAYHIEQDGSISRAVDYRRTGRGSMLTANLNAGIKSMTMRATPFTSREISAFGLIDARFLMPLESGSLLDARSMSAAKRNNVSFSEGMMAAQVEPELQWLLILRAGITRNRMALLNMADPEEQGTTARDLARGFATGEPLPHEPAFIGARDWYRLNEVRLEQYRRAGITSLAIEQIRQNTDTFLQQAEEALKDDDGLRYQQAVGAAMANESAAYQAALDTASDTIRGAIFLLLALVPFSFAMERLLLACSSVYRQILSTMAIFVIMTGILWSFHPAFRISSQPLTIIMAFAVICLALLVISMVYSKFSNELEKMRSGRAEESGARTSRTGVLSTAIRLGIANMRKRKLRTALTGLTVVLITFALLCFVSTSRYVDYRQNTLDAEARFNGVLLRNAGSRPMPPLAVDEVAAYLTPHHQIVPRYWWVQNNNVWRLNVYNRSNGHQVEINAALGLDPGESRLGTIASVCPNWQRFAEHGGCYMAEERARQLGVEPGDTVIVAGQPLEVIGLFDPQQFDSLVHDLDDQPLTPADYGALSLDQIKDIDNTDLARLAHEERGGSGSGEDSGLPHLSSDSVLIVRGDMLKQYVGGGQLRSIAVATADADEAADVARKLADRFAFIVTHGGIGRPATILARVPLVPTAPRSLIIPLLIGGMIIFNTMLSSLAERRREIYVYTSLGLAPLHVGFLFLAEAITYGLMGTIFGYVVGQGVATGLSEMGWLGDITLNYSGTQAIMIMVMVLMVVMVSSLVPAYLAGRLAAPSNVRSWQVPQPEGDTITDFLPFTVTSGTASGIAAFLHDFLDAHKEGVIGDFSTDDLRILPPESEDMPGFGVAATAWLAPYDLGVRQDVTLTIRHGEQEGVYRIHVQIRRASGSVATWHKLNRSFLGSLRRQLLGWRKLLTERILAYIDQGQAARAAAIAKRQQLMDKRTETAVTKAPEEGAALRTKG